MTRIGSELDAKIKEITSKTDTVSTYADYSKDSYKAGECAITDSLGTVIFGSAYTSASYSMEIIPLSLATSVWFSVYNKYSTGFNIRAKIATVYTISGYFAVKEQNWSSGTVVWLTWKYTE